MFEVSLEPEERRCLEAEASCLVEGAGPSDAVEVHGQRKEWPNLIRMGEQLTKARGFVGGPGETRSYIRRVYGPSKKISMV